MEPWLGVCHLYRKTGETREDFTAIVAVFCASREVYDVTISEFAVKQGYNLLWSEEVHPAGQWVARHPKERNAASLARAVYGNRLVEFGTLRATGAEGKAEQPENYLIIEKIENIEPLDLQFGVNHRKTVPESLYEPLFGQPEPTEAELTQYGSIEAMPPMRTYAILDAAKMPYLLTGFLENSGLLSQSLFQGVTAEELKEHSPYLVELTDDNDFTAKLLTGAKGVNGLWEKDLGIYIRSRSEFSELRQHFRKITRVQDNKGQWFLWRFWEGPSLVEYLTLTEKNDQSKAYYLFVRDNVVMVHSFYVLSPRGSSKIHVGKFPELENTDTGIADMRVLKFISLKTSVRIFLDNYLELECIERSDIDYDSKMDKALNVAIRYHKHGFRSNYHIGSFVYWSTALDGDFETQEIKAISENTRISVSERFVLMAWEIKRLHGNKVRNYRGRRNRVLSA